MVYFKDKSSPSGEHHLIILDDQHQPVEKGTILAVYAPLIGGRKAWTLRATHHELLRHQQSNDFVPLRTLGRSIFEGDAKWDVDLQFIGDFHYTKGYWEWTEDVLSRCGKRLRLIDAYDAVYASLFTYDHNSNIIKAFCEARTKCARAHGADEKGGRFIPRSSKYLLYAYHLLQGADNDQCSNVSIDKWVKFWSKKAIKCHLPPPHKEKKTVQPKSTHNPLGDITTHKRWSIAEETLFEKLCIEGNLKEEVYLAAYLACWLCTFVLPDKNVNSIRPSTFKMASMMANGRRVSLAIPVLASIYEDSLPSLARIVWLKMIRFSGEGGVKYYDPQEARKRIHKAEFVSWACNMIVKNRPFRFIDNSDAEELDHDYFIAIRSSYLTLRQGDKFIIEPYSPHRFGRQFGYFQDGPGTLKYDTRAASLEEGLRYWRLCILSKSSSKAWFPGLPTNTKKFCSEAYKAWWAKVHGTFLDDNIACLINPKPAKITIKRKKYEDEQVDGENNPPHVPVPSIVVKSNSQAIAVEASKGKGPLYNLVDSDSSNKDCHWKRQKKELTPLKAVEASASRSPSADFIAQPLEDEIQSIDASEESETSHSWTTTPPPPFGMGLKGKQLPQPPAVSVLEGERFLFSHHKGFLQKMRSDLLVKISNALVDFLSSIEDDVSLILESMKNFHKFDITKVEESLNTFFVKVHAYDEARSLSSQKLSRSLHEQHLKESKARLQDVQSKASEGASKVQSIVDELEHVEKEIVALKGRRMSLCAALKEHKQLNHDAQAKVHEVEEDIATLDNTAPLDDVILEDSKANLEILKKDLKSLKPFA
ncbi:UNVERIFIED_CONTAM: hypothetical protein Slati_3758800 [Sesamum latifolium]|uniref:Aminotransferase-like plant mobile domain-containing protein n=1 Tax=Sesamum latifolium TaxID=2727402 RepID=A0AAW2U7J5_9LAMI